MNLLPAATACHKAVTESNPGKKSQESSEDSQASEFTSILSGALDQKGIAAEATQAKPELTAAQQLQNALQATGQELPLAGESLPLDNTVISAGEIIDNEDASQLQIPLSPDNLVYIPGFVPIAIPADPQINTGMTELSATAVLEGKVLLNNQLNQKASSLPGNIQAGSQGLQESLPAQVMTGENTLNGQPEQRQLFSLPEIQMASTDDKLDFSRIIEKGLSQVNKEMFTSNHVPIADLSSRLSIDSLKSSTETLQLQQHIDKPGWSQELGSRLTWLTKEGVQSAQLRLTPANLGTIDIKISIQNDQANVSFMSQHGAVRDIIEASLPRLREMMLEAGVRLEQANVSTNTNEQQQWRHSDDMPGQQSHNRSSYQLDDENILSSGTLLLEQDSMLSAVDYYA